MKDSREANRPAIGSGPGFDIWFLVVFDLARAQAYWLRYTTFRPAPDREEPARAIVWAAAFDASAPPRAHKALYPIEAFEDRSGPGGFSIRIGDSELGHGVCRGRAGQIAWELRFEPQSAEALRFPAWFSRLPLPTHGHHAHAPARFDGEVRVGGERRLLSGAPGLQVHLYGIRRARELYWIYAPAGELEATSVRARRAVGGREAPALCSLFWRPEKGSAIESFSLPRLMANRVRRLGETLLEARGGDPLRKIRVRAYADPDRFVGYRYRDPAGGDRWVAQSDAASVFAELFERPHRLARWRLARELRAVDRAALELHEDSAPLPDLAFAEWGAPAAAPTSKRAERQAEEQSPGQERAKVAGRGGLFRPLPAPVRVFALGVTYRAHARETGEAAGDPEAFEKSAGSFLPGGGRVLLPSSADLGRALEELEPGLFERARAAVGSIPALMDYEVELGVILLEDAPRERLRAGLVPRVGYFVAGDLTARSVQVLGEGRPERMRYWGRAKSFPAFLPASSRMFVPDDLSAAPLEVRLRTRVNGELRQDSATGDLLLDLPGLLGQASRRLGIDLRAGDYVLTGTPGGVALATPRWKKRVADRILDRFGKLRAVIDQYAASGRFLRPGDRVQLDAGALGAVEATLVV